MVLCVQTRKVAFPSSRPRILFLSLSRDLVGTHLLLHRGKIATHSLSTVLGWLFLIRSSWQRRNRLFGLLLFLTSNSARETRTTRSQSCEFVCRHSGMSEYLWCAHIVFTVRLENCFRFIIFNFHMLIQEVFQQINLVQSKETLQFYTVKLLKYCKYVFRTSAMPWFT